MGKIPYQDFSQSRVEISVVQCGMAGAVTTVSAVDGTF